ncbi:hypothetical protein BX589_11493 [Paraburkholderia fungorum]|jgi:hypothetical protein|uniref:hypothetical protein n=1 Tax=Paraburkholderia fungorum TaxID=134537 RepID=UPI000D08414D|nr:hypothetical protein [Paraburkholderia fungorum]PRZ52419.1 hypothetical protein BX589_11493 [Paraburkholderia fungorum]
MFRLALSPETRAALDEHRRTIDRLYALTDRWLAAELLRLSRQIRQANPQLQPTDITYEARFLWHLVPEIARRLGANSFLSNERTDAAIVMYTPVRLREHAGYALGNMSKQLLGRSAAVTTLLNEPCNGNPVAFALDRISPPIRGTNDPIAESIIEIADRRGIQSAGHWTPAMNQYNGRASSML